MAREHEFVIFHFDDGHGFLAGEDFECDDGKMLEAMDCTYPYRSAVLKRFKVALVAT